MTPTPSWQPGIMHESRATVTVLVGSYKYSMIVSGIRCLSPQEIELIELMLIKSGPGIQSIDKDQCRFGCTGSAFRA
jgi:hypothetical protein